MTKIAWFVSILIESGGLRMAIKKMIIVLRYWLWKYLGKDRIKKQLVFALNLRDLKKST